MTTDPVLVGGRYALDGLLGRGGMAEVRRATDTRLSRQVAVKQLRADLAGDPTFQARFRREAQSAAGLNHPTIVAVYDTGEESDPATGVSVPYIVMELVEGPTLRDVLREGRKILPERALEMTAGVLDALTYSHRAGIVHRDIKPANVMLTKSGGVKVMDFGIARAVADTSATMTQTAAVIGTAQYLSPEQARGETVDARSDIYSAGCLLYELLVGRPPFVGDSPVSVAYQHVREQPAPPSELDSQISPEIDAITLKALAKDPAHRYQTGSEMKADITRVLAGEQVTAPLPPAASGEEAEPTRRTAVVPAPGPAGGEEDETATAATAADEQPKRRVGVIVGVIALVLALVGAGGYGIWSVVHDAAPVAQVSVPAVKGFNRDQAESTLRNAQLVPSTKTVTGPDDNTVGTVLTETPDGGTMAPAGSTVVIEVNSGPKMVTVPQDLIGKDKDKVADILKKEGLDANLQPSTSEPDDAEKDQVLSIDPAAGASVAEGSSVTVMYATGSSKVPSVQGLSRLAAEGQLQQAGFDNVRIREQVSSAEDPGTVLSQDPTGGSSAARSSRITLTVAKAPASPSPTPSSSSPSPSASTSPSSSASSSPSGRSTKHPGSV